MEDAVPRVLDGGHRVERVRRDLEARVDLALRDRRAHAVPLRAVHAVAGALRRRLASKQGVEFAAGGVV